MGLYYNSSHVLISPGTFILDMEHNLAVLIQAKILLKFMALGALRSGGLGY